ncbi:MAG: hypothetical protein HFI64_12550 [Lachnospiraceae bacterium]|nr:hypothetical protein [Lachnospiraceae bacterium]
MARGKKQTAVKAVAPEAAGKAVEKKEILQTEQMKRAAEELAKVVAEKKEVPAPESTKKTEKTAEKKAAEKTETEKPADAPKDTALKAAKKTTEEKKTTTRKAKAVAEKKAAEKPAEEKKSVKEPEVKTSISVQYMGKDVSDKDMIALVKNDWADAGHKVGDIETMDLYVKTEENRVYYVINGAETGSVEI